MWRRGKEPGPAQKGLSETLRGLHSPRAGSSGQKLNLQEQRGDAGARWEETLAPRSLLTLWEAPGTVMPASAAIIPSEQALQQDQSALTLLCSLFRGLSDSGSALGLPEASSEQKAALAIAPQVGCRPAGPLPSSHICELPPEWTVVVSFIEGMASYTHPTQV